MTEATKQSYHEGKSVEAKNIIFKNWHTYSVVNT